MATGYITLVDGSRRQVEAIEAYGFTLLRHHDNSLAEDGGVKGHMEKMFELDVRDDDDIICAYPKSGTHWLYEIVSMLRNGNSSYVLHSKEIQSLNFCTVPKIDSLPSPRLLNAHFPVNRLPKQWIQQRKRILRISRNPKDVVVSMWAMHIQISTWDYDGSFADYLPLFLGENGKNFFCSWFKYELEWEKFCKTNPDYPILNLTFEDLKENPVAIIRRTADFLGLPCDETLATAISKTCDFQNLKQANDKIKEDSCRKISKTGEPFIYRKGVVGDWKNWFTVAQSEHFDRVYAREMKNSSLSFRYTL